MADRSKLDMLGEKHRKCLQVAESHTSNRQTRVKPIGAPIGPINHERLTGRNGIFQGRKKRNCFQLAGSHTSNRQTRVKPIGPNNHEWLTGRNGIR